MACELVDLGQQGTKMKIIFVRHGEPDYSMLDKLENPQLYSGFGRDLAPLTGKGRSLTKEDQDPQFGQRPRYLGEL